MKKLLVTVSVVGLLALFSAVPAFAGGAPDDAVQGEPDCFGKMASGQAQDHGGWQNVAEDHGKDSTIEGIDSGKGFCAG